jgi:hypothetical protein
MIKYLLLSEQRCGGTNLVRSIALHPDVVVPDIEACQELLDPLSAFLNKELPKTEMEWLRLFDKFWSDRDIWHLQRTQLPTGTGGWSALAKLAPKTIALYRKDLELQYLSWLHGHLTNVWHGKRTPLENPWWRPELYAQWAGQWMAYRVWAERALPAGMCLWLSYEMLEENWQRCLRQCFAHLELEPVDVPQAMLRPTPIDYFTVFNVTREEMRKFRPR